MKLSLVRTVAPLPIEERGQLLDAGGVALTVFGGHVGKKWVHERVPAILRHKVGRKVLYYENEVRRWADTLREAA